MKNERFRVSREFLGYFEDKGEEFLRQTLTGDET
jgi:hypothetical protein